MRHTKEAAAESEDGNSRVSTSSLHKSKRMEVRRGVRVRERRSRTRNLLYGIESMSGEAKSKVAGNEVSGEDTDGRTGTPIEGTDQSKEKYVSIDCEMVGVVGNRSGLAKCSILDYEGRVLFNEYIRPDEPIVDYRTRWSGIRPHHMKDAITYEVAVQRIKEILEGSIVIGHDLIHDFLALGISPHPYKQIRDTAKFPLLREVAGLGVKHRPSLKRLAAKLLGRRIQCGPHCSLEDAHAALDIYRKYETAWEDHLLDRKVWLEDQFWPEEIVCC